MGLSSGAASGVPVQAARSRGKSRVRWRMVLEFIYQVAEQSTLYKNVQLINIDGNN